MQEGLVTSTEIEVEKRKARRGNMQTQSPKKKKRARTKKVLLINHVPFITWLIQSRRFLSTRLWVSLRRCSLSRAVRASRGLRLRILTPARSNDFVVLKVSDEMLPSNRNVLGTELAPVAEEAFALSDDSPAFPALALLLLLLLVVAGFALMAFDEDEIDPDNVSDVAAVADVEEDGAEGSWEPGGGAEWWPEG